MQKAVEILKGRGKVGRPSGAWKGHVGAHAGYISEEKECDRACQV